jgi:hypothetical protein
LKKLNREKKSIGLVQFRFYKLETEKTKPNSNKKKPEKNQAKPEKNRKNRAKPV